MKTFNELPHSMCYSLINSFKSNTILKRIMLGDAKLKMVILDLNVVIVAYENFHPTHFSFTEIITAWYSIFSTSVMNALNVLEWTWAKQGLGSEKSWVSCKRDHLRTNLFALIRKCSWTSYGREWWTMSTNEDSRTMTRLIILTIYSHGW